MKRWRFWAGVAAWASGCTGIFAAGALFVTGSDRWAVETLMVLGSIAALSGGFMIRDGEP